MNIQDEIRMIKKINSNDGTITAICDVLLAMAEKVEDKKPIGFQAK